MDILSRLSEFRTFCKTKDKPSRGRSAKLRRQIQWRVNLQRRNSFNDIILPCKSPWRLWRWRWTATPTLPTRRYGFATTAVRATIPMITWVGIVVWRHERPLYEPHVGRYRSAFWLIEPKPNHFTEIFLGLSERRTRALQPCRRRRKRLPVNDNGNQKEWRRTRCRTQAAGNRVCTAHLQTLYRAASCKESITHLRSSPQQRFQQRDQPTVIWRHHGRRGKISAEALRSLF